MYTDGHCQPQEIVKRVHRWPLPATVCCARCLSIAIAIHSERPIVREVSIDSHYPPQQIVQPIRRRLWRHSGLCKLSIERHYPPKYIVQHINRWPLQATIDWGTIDRHYRRQQTRPMTICHCYCRGPCLLFSGHMLTNRGYKPRDLESCGEAKHA